MWAPGGHGLSVISHPCTPTAPVGQGWAYNLQQYVPRSFSQYLRYRPVQVDSTSPYPPCPSLQGRAYGQGHVLVTVEQASPSTQGRLLLAPWCARSYGRHAYSWPLHPSRCCTGTAIHPYLRHPRSRTPQKPSAPSLSSIHHIY